VLNQSNTFIPNIGAFNFFTTWRRTEAALLRLVTDPGDKSRAARKLNGRTFEKLLGLFDGFAVGKELQRIVG
jgi:hypothetical protein